MFPFSVLQCSHARKLVQITNQQSYIPTNCPPGLVLMLLRLHLTCTLFSPPSPLINITFIPIKLGKHKGKCVHSKRLVLLCFSVFVVRCCLEFASLQHFSFCFVLGEGQERAKGFVSRGSNEALLLVMSCRQCSHGCVGLPSSLHVN